MFLVLQVLYLLYESASGYSLFQAYGLDEIGQNTDTIQQSIVDLTRFGKVVKLIAFTPFSSALNALEQINAISEGMSDIVSAFYASLYFDVISHFPQHFFFFCYFDLEDF